MKVHRQQRHRMTRGTGKTQKKSAERRQKLLAQAPDKQALDKKQRCLVEGEERFLEALSFEVTPTTEVAEEARLKAMIVEARKKAEYDQRDICDISTHTHTEITPEEMQRHRRIEEEKRSTCQRMERKRQERMARGNDGTEVENSGK